MTAREAGGCQVHDWPTADLTRRVADLLRANPPGRGVGMCAECWARFGDAPEPVSGWAAFRGDVWQP